MRSQADPYSPGKPPLVKVAGWIIPMIAIAWAVADIAELSTLVTRGVIAVGAVALVVAWWLALRRWQKRSELPALLRKNLAGVLRTELLPGSLVTSGHSFGSVLKVGPPKKIKIKAAGLPPVEGETAHRVLHIAGEISENVYVIDTKKSAPGKRIVLRQKPAEKKVDLSPRQRIEQNVRQGASEIFPKHSPKVVFDWDDANTEEDYLLGVTITGVPGMDLSIPGKRRMILVKLRTRLPKGNFKNDVDPSEDTIYFKRSKPLPAAVVPPKGHAPLLANHQAYKDFIVPLGVGDNGSQATWQPKKDAHLLIIGGTGGGKTIAEHGVIQALTQAGWRTWLVDGKRVEFIGYRNWPNVELLAQRVDHHIRVLKLAHETMEARYELIESGQIKVEDLDPVAIVVDELTTLLMAVKRRYQDTKEKGMPAANPVLEWVADIARLGRTAKMHLVLGLQRPDASIMGGEMRDNFGGRISLGKLRSKEASMMMWDDAAIGVSVPNIKGRAVAPVNGALGMVQGTYTANPDPNSDDYHPGMVEAMRPTVEAYTRKTIAAPEVSVDEDGAEGPMTWTRIIEAKLLDAEGNAVTFDPVSSEESKALRRTNKAAPVSDANSTLQVAESREDALDLFPYDPLDKITYGNQLARKLSALAQEIQGSSESTRTPEPVPSQSLISISEKSLGQGSTTQLRYVEPGQIILVDDLGGEDIVVSSCEADGEDSEVYYLAGYSAEGEPVHAELPADTVVEVFENSEPAQPQTV